MREVSSPTIFRTPLFRLLAINLALGMSVAALLVAGLLWLDLVGLRHLIFSDRSPAVALGLLLFGFIVTFGSVVMGTAVMAMGRRDGENDESCDGNGEVVPLGVRTKQS